jgi:RNA polymerase sigma-70 factor, ECF subfamily
MTAIFKKYKNSIFWYIFKMVGSVEDAEDLMILTFEKAYCRRETFTFDYSYSTWLFTIARNTVFDFLKTKKKNSKTNELNDMIRMPVIAPVIDTIIADDLKNHIVKQIKQMNTKRSKVMMLHMEGYKDEEIVSETGLSHVAVRTLICRGKAELKEFIKNLN